MLLGGVRSHSFSDLFELQPAGPTASRCHCPTPEVRESLPTHFAQARQSEIIIINHKFHKSCIHRPMSENKRTRTQTHSHAAQAHSRRGAKEKTTSSERRHMRANLEEPRV